MTVSGSVEEMFHSHYDGITFNIHREVFIDINRHKVGDMVETAEGNVGLIVSEVGYDRQGFAEYQIMIGDNKYMYTALEIYPLEKK
jgi:hypothetical protein